MTGRIVKYRASGGSWARYGAATVVTPTPVTPTPTTLPTYGPVSITSTADGVARGVLTAYPTDVTEVTFPVSLLPTTYLSAWLRTLTANQMGVLPEVGTSSPYLVDTTNGFTGTGSYDAIVRMPGRGFVTLGPGAVIRYGPSSFSADATAYQNGGAPQAKVFESVLNNLYIGNAAIIGRDLGGVAFHCIWHSGSNATFERLYLLGANRGFKNAPPGEVGGICGNQNTGVRILNCEIDGRDETSGARVSTSPIMFNNQSSGAVSDCYFHHTIAGMPTNYKGTGAWTYTRVRSEYCGSNTGSLNGSAFNFEICAGTYTLTDCTMRPNWHNTSPDAGSAGTYNSGLHTSIGTNTGSAVFWFVNPTFDTGPNGHFYMQLNTYSPDTQVYTDIHVTDSAGNSLVYYPLSK